MRFTVAALALSTAVITAGGAATPANARRGAVPGAIVSIAPWKSGHVFHTGETMQYDALIVDWSTKHGLLPAGSVQFHLEIANREIALPSKRYKSWSWQGSTRFASGWVGKARIVADVVAAGHRFRSHSVWFFIQAPVVTRVVAHDSATGDFAVAIATGSIRRPAERSVLAVVTTSPSQPVKMHWKADCIRESPFAIITAKGSDAGGGPGTPLGHEVIERIRLPIPNAYSCVIQMTAMLSDSGTLKIQIYGRSWPMSKK
jgi:hypothetical protein